MNPCRYCDKPIEGEPARTLAYWSQTPCVCHPECKQAGERQEAIDCQTIDADCNDCKHFERGSEIVRSIPKGFSGRCAKFDRPTAAYPKTWTGRECFEHRRV